MTVIIHLSKVVDIPKIDIFLVNKRKYIYIELTTCHETIEWNSLRLTKRVCDRAKLVSSPPWKTSDYKLIFFLSFQDQGDQFNDNCYINYFLEIKNQSYPVIPAESHERVSFTS